MGACVSVKYMSEGMGAFKVAWEVVCFDGKFSISLEKLKGSSFISNYYDYVSLNIS